jgi:hypothetical protein
MSCGVVIVVFEVDHAAVGLFLSSFPRELREIAAPSEACPPAGTRPLLSTREFLEASIAVGRGMVSSGQQQH